MKTVTALAALLAITIGTAATQAQQEPQKMTPPEVVLTGCVVQGATPDVFIFDNAKKDPASTTEKGVRYILTSAVEDVDLRTHLNHEVRITGEVDLKVSAMPVVPPTTPPDPQRPAEESTLPKLKAKSLTLVSDTCAMVR